MEIAQPIQWRQNCGVKGEGHSKKRIFFVNSNKNLAPSLATQRSFSF